MSLSRLLHLPLAVVNVLLSFARKVLLCNRPYIVGVQSCWLRTLYSQEAGNCWFVRGRVVVAAHSELLFVGGGMADILHKHAEGLLELLFLCTVLCTDHRRFLSQQL